MWSFLYDDVFVGATRAREMRDIMLAPTFLVFLLASYLLQPLGNDGLWLAFLLLMAGRGIGMHSYYGRRVLPVAGGPGALRWPGAPDTFPCGYVHARRLGSGARPVAGRLLRDKTQTERRIRVVTDHGIRLRRKTTRKTGEPCPAFTT